MTARPIAAAFAGLLLLTAANAAEYVRDPAKVHAGAYAVEPEHTEVLFGVSHFGFSTYYGRFTGASGTLLFDSATPANSVLAISVPSATVSTASDKLNGILKSVGWFEAARFPAVNFRSTKVTVTGTDRGIVVGDLTMRGVTRPLTLEVRFDGAGTDPADNQYTLGFDATGTLRRSDFGISTFTPFIGDEVRLILSGAFVKQH